MAQPNTNIRLKRAPRPIRNPNGNVWFWVIMGVVFLLLMVCSRQVECKNRERADLL